MSQLARQGLAILMISSELPEVLGMSDRVLVMRGGRIVAEFDEAEATPDAVGAAMMRISAASGGGLMSDGEPVAVTGACRPIASAARSAPTARS